MAEQYKSRVYTDRPAYADYEAPAKFEAIKSIIGRRLLEHPNAICSYSGGSDSDIMLHLIEQVRKMFDLPPVQYCFFNTGLEMQAIKRHVKETEKLYGVTITEYRPKKNIVLATREYGLPFISKIMSSGLEGIQKKNVFGVSYLYREKYNEYKKQRQITKTIDPAQLSFDEIDTN